MMKKKIVAIVLSIGMTFSMPAIASAESLEERITALEKRVAELEEMVGIDSNDEGKSNITDKLSGIDIEQELMSSFEKYQIDFYEDEDVLYFDESDLPKPETVVKNFPNYSDELSQDDLYFYVDFDDNEECQAYVAAYSLYLMHLGHEIKESSSGNMFTVDNKYTIGYADNDGKKCFAVALLPLN